MKSKILEDMGYAPDLNITDRRKNMWCLYYFDNVKTLNKPTIASGIMILYTNTDSKDYGGAYAFCNGNIFGRTLNAGEYMEWQQIF